MRRPYPSYFDEWPGFGLLLLRLGEGVPSILSATHTARFTDWIAVSLSGVEIAAGALLIVGLCTPIAAIVETLLELMHMTGGGDRTDVHLFRAVVAASLAMLGPGVWSVEARLFGRRRIDVKALRD